MRVGVAALAATVLAAGCSDAIVVRVDGDLPIGRGVDSMCLAVADRDPAGGHVGQRYPLAELPQTLRVEPGEASEARAWVVGYRAGVPIARDASALDFGDDVTLRLDRCYAAPGGAPTARGEPQGAANAVLATVVGRNGTRVLAAGATSSTFVDVDAAGALVELPGPPQLGGPVRAAVAFDADGDCDDDLVIVADGAPPALARDEGATFDAAGAIGDTAMRAAAAADVDRDGDIDVVVGGGGTLALHRNDGSGRFVFDPAALTATGFVTDVTALAFGDLDADGSVDLVVGQASGPIRAFAGAAGGGGLFTGAPGVLPDAPVAVASLRLADADGDADPDLWVAVDGGPARLYVDREGALEDQSFIRLPQPAPEAAGFAVGGWDDDCAIDAVVAAPVGGALWRGDGTGTLVADGAAPAATAAELADLDDDGDPDLVLATPEGVVWLAR
jgi:hypothetical protein